MKNLLFYFSLFCSFQFLSATLLSTNFDENTTLSSSGNPFQITTDIEVNSGVTLSIEEGVIIEVCTGCALTVYGKLFVDGSQSGDRITFEGDSWKGIIIKNESEISYSDFIGATEGIFFDDSVQKKIVLEHCNFLGSDTSASTNYLDFNFLSDSEASVEIRNCKFEYIKNRIINTVNVDNVTIFNSSFSHNHAPNTVYAIYMDAGSGKVGGFVFDELLFINNTNYNLIFGAPYIETPFIISNSIFQDNIVEQVFIETTGAGFQFLNNLVEFCQSSEQFFVNDDGVFYNNIIRRNVIIDGISMFKYQANGNLFNFTYNTINDNIIDTYEMFEFLGSYQDVYFCHNNITNTVGGVYRLFLYSSTSPDSVINYNIFQNPDLDKEVETTGIYALDVRYNWWGSSDISYVEERIYDYFRHSGKNVQLFIPWINEYFNTEALSYEYRDHYIIEEDTTWTLASSPITIGYEYGYVFVGENAVLTIEPGVEVNIPGQIKLFGNIVAEGTEEQRIIFRGSRGGQWEGITLKNDSSFRYCDFIGAEVSIEYDYPTSQSEVVLDHINFLGTVEDNAQRYLYIKNSIGIMPVSITNCVFDNIHAYNTIQTSGVGPFIFSNNNVSHGVQYSTGLWIWLSGEPSYSVFDNNRFVNITTNTLIDEKDDLPVTITNNYFADNVVKYGLIKTTSSPLVVENNVFENNYVSDTYLFDNIEATYRNNEFLDNINDGTSMFHYSTDTYFNFTSNVVVGNILNGATKMFDVADYSFLFYDNMIMNNNCPDDETERYIFDITGTAIDQRIVYNDISNPNITYEIKLGTTGLPAGLDCVNNYWGAGTNISLRVFDFYDEASRRKVYYTPYSSTPLTIQCFGIPALDSSSCNGEFGNCTFQDTCSCVTGYTGSECETITMCYDIPFNDSLVCFGNGVCESLDYCNCYDETYLGEQCEFKSYFHFMKGYMDYDNELPVFTCNELSSAPPARSRGKAYTFKNHQSYIFGGYGIDSKGNEGYLNDVFLLSVSDDLWCFIKGSVDCNQTSSDYSLGTLQFSDTHEISSRANFGGFESLFSFFVIGGSLTPMSDFSKYETNEVWEFQIGTTNFHGHEWRILWEDEPDPSLLAQPSKRSNFCGSKISDFDYYFFGGSETLDDGTRAMKNDLWIYRSIENEFEILYNGTTTQYNESSMDFSFDGNVNDGVPYERMDSICWVDPNSVSNNFFVFGGTLLNSLSSNDLWLFNSTWSYIQGNQNSSDAGVSMAYYDSSNFPAVRSGVIFFNNQFDSLLNNFVLFFGGMNVREGWTYCDMWAFSNSLMQFKFINGTDEVMNVRNQGIYQIGSRGFGMGVYKRSKHLLIIGGEYGL